MTAGIKVLGGDPMAERTRYLTDEQRERPELFLPQTKRGPPGRRPWVLNRQVMEGILSILRTAAGWKDLPERCGSLSSRWYHLKL